MEKKIEMKFLIIAGVSGTGKSYLRESLFKQRPDLFYICPQVTTRDLRENESIYNYIFIENVTYDLFNSINILVGKTKIKENRYGSIVNNFTNKIGIIILNEKGLIDFQDYMKKNQDKKFKCLFLGLDKDLDSIEIKRKGRNREYLEQERNVLKYCNPVFKLNKEKPWVSSDDVIKISEEYFC